ncbi:MAG: S41 family peptidase [Muribaculaceae bacterium]|nr:S41 family peptidase [Muribaculaceae bacterium]
MKYILSILLCALAVSAGAQQQQFNNDMKLRMANAVIEQFYVEPVNGDTITDEAIRAMLKTLDPHSAYSTPAETKEFTEPLEGKFSGIGIQFNMLEDTVYVIQTVSGGPSEKVGILPGDRIISANDTVIAGKKLVNTKVMKVLRGPKGSTVDLKVKRGPEIIDFTVTRDDIPIYSVDETFMADPTTGYIRITRFAEETAKEVREAIAKLRAQGMQNLIIDLSDNGGGYLGSAFELASEFLPEGTPVVSTAGRASQPAQYVTEGRGMMPKGRVVVIVNQTSASASEILSGALQDNDRAVIVGRRTFGKGLVQRPFPFPDGSMIRLTVARYYTPSGRCIQKHYDKGHGEEYQLDLLNRYTAGELWHADSIARPDSLKYETLRNHRPVYGGGGIIPDVFVPADTSYYSVYYRDIVAKGILNRSTVSYVDAHRAELKKQYPTEESYVAHFTVPEDFMSSLIAKATDAGIEYNEEQYQRSLPLMTAIIKGLIARDLYENASYFRHIAPLNKDYLEALRVIHDPSRYNRILLTGEDPSPVQETATPAATE